MNGVQLLRAVLAAVVTAVAVGGCAAGSSDASGGGRATVLAAASLSDAFRAEGEAFEKAHPGDEVRFSFAGSQTLVAQVRQGAPADVLALADERSMAAAAAALAGTPTIFATNRLAIAVPPGNPDHVSGLADLARPGLTVVLAAPDVPAGAYARAALDAAGVTVHPRSLEDNVRAVLTKVELGEADAGIVYATDVAAAAGKVDAVPVDDSPVARYPIARVTDDPVGRAFVDFVLSAPGQRILSRYGFLPPP